MSKSKRDAGDEVESDWPDFAPGDRVAGFTVEGRLANGSFGTVYRANRDGRPFAIKLVPMGSRADREVDALRRAQLPNVVGFSGYGMWPDEKPRFLVLALELVEGRTLDVWGREENPCALKLVHEVMVPLACTLADVHAASVVHRDVKEANILIRDADGEPVLVDFGAAGYVGAPRLTAVLPPGTPEYRSPEALRFAREDEGPGPYPAGPGDDLWALGVTLYFILTRELPFGDRRRPGLNRAIRYEVPPAPRELNPRVPPALSQLCMRMLEKAPEARYADAEALAEALEEAAAPADEPWRVPLFPGPERGKRPTPAARVRAWARGWPWAVLAVGLELLLLLTPAPAPAPRRIALQVAPIAPREVSPLPPPMSQASSSRKLAPAKVTGEVARGAGPSKSPTPAPVAKATHCEEDPMFKSKKTLGMAAAALVTGSACVSGPQLKPPPPADCPPGYLETFERFGLFSHLQHAMYVIPYEMDFRTDFVPVPPNPMKLLQVGPDSMGTVPLDAVFVGQSFITKDRVYGHFTELRLPSGENLPICLEIFDFGERGTPMDKGSTPEKPTLLNVIKVMAVDRFK
ncbi:serine/threonine-protein kinase [Archangium sp.]|uniref:serine/threonine protein kinase n=1 Tax=Archangium sp. TaxID=1872627 RepID=UPI00286BD6F8|nr:serine/threonine-protein kinase [Archangium sp.]